jgi:DNA-binding FadR family transcriptional regulator
MTGDIDDSEPRISHTARVTREIGLGIVSGGYPQGSLLPGDADLMYRFGVSRTVLREALKTLAGKGLILARARIGTRVQDRSQWNLFDPDVLIWHARSGFDPAFRVHLSELRMALEPEAAALAAARRTPAQLAEIRRWADALAAPDITPEGFVEADRNLHLAVAAAAANPFMLSISTLIEVALDAVLMVSQPVRDPPRLRRSIAQHRAIADAIASSDPKAARAAMVEVIQEGLNVL